MICVIVGIGFALPNFYGEDPALMIAKENGLTFSEQEIKDIDKYFNRIQRKKPLTKKHLKKITKNIFKNVKKILPDQKIE